MIDYIPQPDRFISRFHRAPTPPKKVPPPPIHSRFITHPRTNEEKERALLEDQT